MMCIFSKKFNWLLASSLIINFAVIPYALAVTPHNYAIKTIDKNTLYVAYSNNTHTTRDLVENEVFNKCAQLTLNSGFTYFSLNKSQLSTQPISNNYSSDKEARFIYVKTKDGKTKTEGYIKPVVTITQFRFTVATQLEMTNAIPDNTQATYYDAKAVTKGLASLINHFPRINQNPNSEPNQLAAADTATPVSSKSNPLLTLKPVQAVIDWTNKSHQFLKAGEFLDAIRTASAAIALDPFYDIHYVNRATAYVQQGYSDKAITDIERALWLNPNNSIALNIKGYILQNQGNNKQAAPFYQKACKLKLEFACQNHEEVAGYRPDSLESHTKYLLKRSLQAFNKKQWDEVINLSTQVLQLDPNNVRAYTNRGGALSEQGNLEQALSDINQAIKIDPDFAAAYNNRGYIYQLMDDPRSASLEYAMSCKMGIKSSCRELIKINSVAKN